MKWLNWCFTSSTILHVFLIRGLVSVNFVTRLTLKHVTILCVASWAILLVEVENDFEHWSQSLLFLWYWWMWELNCFLVLKAFSGPPDQAFFANEFLLSMCPIVVLEEPILFKVFWFPFGALLVNVRAFWLHFGPCWLHVGPFWLHFRSILDAPGWILQEINRIWNPSPQVGFSHKKLVAKRKNN